MKEKRKNILQKLSAAAICLPLVLAGFPLAANEVHADGVIGYLTINGSRRSYTDFEDLVDDLEDCEGDTVVIEMAKDWNAAGDDQFNRRMVIPEDSKVTFDMHGHIFNRALVADDDYERDGELMYVENDAVLTINGASNEEEKQTVHKYVPYFSAREQDYAPGRMTVYGACLSGGNSIDGPGAIYLDSGKKAVISDVSFVGNKANYQFDPFVTTGYGGAILISEDGTELTLKNCLLTGNLAEEDGGAIYGANDDKIVITLDNTVIESNRANSDGGGINVDGEEIYITGINGSALHANECKDKGGGLYIWNDDVTVRGLYIYENTASLGGGVYSQEEDIELANLTIKRNYASKRGSGVYIENDGNIIDSCTITNNYTNGGVYVEDDCDEGMKITGSTVIKDNEGGNLILEDGSSHFEIGHNLSMDVHIGYVENPDDAWGYSISPGPCEDYSDQLTADDSNYFIAYSYLDTVEDTTARRLRYLKKSEESDEKGHARKPYETQTVLTQNAHSYHHDKVYAGGYTEEEGGKGTQYELLRGFAHHTSGGMATDSDFLYFYSDGFFYEEDGTSNPFVYNDHLATASWGLAQSGAYLSSPGYNHKHAGARQFMADIGCGDQMIYVNDCDVSVPGLNTMGVAIGAKNLQKYDGDTLADTGDVLIAIALRGANYEKEWGGNVTLGSGNEDRGADKKGEALGFSMAADEVMKSVEFFIDRYGLKEKIEEGKVRFWISGFSRAGATTNITAKRLVEKYCYNNDGSPRYGEESRCNQVFAYPLEAPKGGTDNAEMINDKTRYYCIHNIVNTGDIVPLVAPQEMGFKRYGVDHFIPGTALDRNQPYTVKVFVTNTEGGAPAGVTRMTTYCDNTPLDTKKDKDSNETALYKEYVSRRDKMIKQLKAIDHTLLFYDYFHPYSFEYSWPPYSKFGRFDGAKLEDYLPDFMAFLQQEAAKNRGKYAVDKVKVNGKEYYTMQQLAIDYFAAEGAEERKFDALKEAVEKIYKNWVDDVYLFNLVGYYFRQNGKIQEETVTKIWKFAEEEGAFSKLTPEEYSVVKKYWFTAADTALHFTDGDWDLGQDHMPGDPVFPTGREWTNSGFHDISELMYSLTLVLNADMIINKNHKMEIGNAWTRTYDSYYIDAKGDPKYPFEVDVNWVDRDNPYNVDRYSVEAPSAYIPDAEAEQSEDGRRIYVKLAENDRNANVFSGRQKVLLEVGNVHDDANPKAQTDTRGEAIYYDLYDITDGEENARQLAENLIYRGGVDLSLDSGERSYKIVAHAYSLGVDSEEAVYYVNLLSGRHMVSVNDGAGIDQWNVYHYIEGDRVTVYAQPDQDEYFVKWTVRLLDENGDVIAEDIAPSLMSNQENREKVTFEMPFENVDTYDGTNVYPQSYRLEIKAECGNRITALRTPQAQTEGEDLPHVPVAGESNLDKEIQLWFWSDDSSGYWTQEDVTYPITWTFTYNGYEYSCSSDDAVFGNSQYKATIIVPKDEENGLIFAPSPTGSCRTGNITCTRNEADGSLRVEIVFAQTEDGINPPAAPEEEIPLRIRMLDMSRPDEDPGSALVSGIYYVHPGKSVNVSEQGPNAYRFIEWVFDEPYCDPYIKPAEGTDIQSRTITVDIPEVITSGNHYLYARYQPVVSALQAKLEPPVGGEEIQTAATDEEGNETLRLYFEGSYYTVHPDFVEISWSPAPLLATTAQKANFLTAYTASVHIVPKTDENGEYIMVKSKYTSGYVRRSTDMYFTEDPTVYMNDDRAFYDVVTRSVCYTFPITEYELEKVYQPSDITAIPYGADKETVREYLPSTVQILLNDGSMMDVEVTWSDLQRAFDSGDPYDAKTWLAAGTITLPFGVNNKEGEEAVSLEVVIHAYVDAAGAVSVPEASVPSGKYIEDQLVTLSCETEGAAVYYTLDPEASDTDDFANDPRWILYDGSEIAVNRADAAEDETDIEGNPTGRKLLTLRCAAAKDGMRESTIREYIYVFGNDVPVPEGQNHQYNFRCQVGVKGSEYYTLKALSIGEYINNNGDAVASLPGIYKAKATIKEGYQWEIRDPETGEVTYTTEDQIITFTIRLLDSDEVPEGPSKEYTLTFDLNGGTLDEKTGKVIMDVAEGMIITMPKPEKEGYEFDCWKGSKYEAGEEYTVKEDHTFVAQWKTDGQDEPSETDVPDDSGNSGGKDGADTSDHNNALLWGSLMTLALLAAGLNMILRKKSE